jgi:PAS domain-containing protein
LSTGAGAEAIFGYSNVEAVGHGLSELIVPHEYIDEACNGTRETTP